MADKINIAGVIDGVSKVLAGAQGLVPIAQRLGLPSVVANAATIAIATTAVVENVLERSGELKLAMTTQDEAKLRAMLAELQTVNDALAGTIQTG